MKRVVWTGACVACRSGALSSLLTLGAASRSDDRPLGLHGRLPATKETFDEPIHAWLAYGVKVKSRWSVTSTEGSGMTLRAQGKRLGVCV